jgi:hypothetical protein
VTPSGGTIKNLELTLIADRGASPTSVSSGNRVYKTATLSGTRHVAISVAIPSKVTSGKVTVTARANGDDPKADRDVAEVTKTQALTVKKPKSSSSGSSGSSGSSSSGSSGSSSETTSGSDLPVGSGSDTTTTTPTTGNPAVLPTIAPPQTPSTAPGPGVVNTGNAQSMRGTEDAADQLTFDKLASTQAAWLAALLVAFSLLLTQVRLGRAAAARDPKAKGAHRRTRRTNGAH